jgi:hypothetical protein
VNWIVRIGVLIAIIATIFVFDPPIADDVTQITRTNASQTWGTVAFIALIVTLGAVWLRNYISKK